MFTAVLYRIPYLLLFYFVSGAPKQTSDLRKTHGDTSMLANKKLESKEETVNKMTFSNSLESTGKKQLLEERSGVEKKGSRK